jgi:hypothetical protein
LISAELPKKRSGQGRKEGHRGFGFVVYASKETTDAVAAATDLILDSNVVCVDTRAIFSDLISKHDFSFYFYV